MARRIVIVARDPWLEEAIIAAVRGAADVYKEQGMNYPSGSPERQRYFAASNALRNPATFDEDDTGWLLAPIAEVIEP